jgi:hypothetical protein
VPRRDLRRTGRGRARRRVRRPSAGHKPASRDVATMANGSIQNRAHSLDHQVSAGTPSTPSRTHPARPDLCSFGMGYRVAGCVTGSDAAAIAPGSVPPCPSERQALASGSRARRCRALSAADGTTCSVPQSPCTMTAYEPMPINSAPVTSRPGRRSFSKAPLVGSNSTSDSFPRSSPSVLRTRLPSGS